MASVTQYQNDLTYKKQNRWQVRSFSDEQGYGWSRKKVDAVNHLSILDMFFQNAVISAAGSGRKKNNQ